MNGVADLPSLVLPELDEVLRLANASSWRWDLERALPDWLDGTDLADAPRVVPSLPKMSATDPFVAEEDFPEPLPVVILVAPQPVALTTTEAARVPPEAEPLPVVELVQRFEMPPNEEPVAYPAVSQAAIETKADLDLTFTSINDLARCFDIAPEPDETLEEEPEAETEPILTSLETAKEALDSLAELSNLIDQVAKSLPSYDAFEEPKSADDTVVEEGWLGDMCRRQATDEELLEARLCLLLEAAGRRFAVPLHAVQRTRNLRGAEAADGSDLDLVSLVEGRRLQAAVRARVRVELVGPPGEVTALLADRNLGPCNLHWQPADEADAAPPSWVLAVAERNGSPVSLLDLETLLVPGFAVAG